MLRAFSATAAPGVVVDWWDGAVGSGESVSIQDCGVSNRLKFEASACSKGLGTNFIRARGTLRFDTARGCLRSDLIVCGFMSVRNSPAVTSSAAVAPLVCLPAANAACIGLVAVLLKAISSTGDSSNGGATSAFIDRRSNSFFQFLRTLASASF